jgi:hypothetical protein
LKDISTTKNNEIKGDKNMIDQILKLVRDNSTEEIINNPSVPNEKNETAISLVSEQITDGIKNIFNNPSQITNLMGGGSFSTIVSQLINSTSKKLSSELGLGENLTQSISEKILPKIMSRFTSKLADPADNDITFSGLIKQFSGSSNLGDLSAMIERFITPSKQEFSQEDGNNEASSIQNAVSALFGFDKPAEDKPSATVNVISNKEEVIV